MKLTISKMNLGILEQNTISLLSIGPTLHLKDMKVGLSRQSKQQTVSVKHLSLSSTVEYVIT